jgi:hypothetical protein
VAARPTPASPDRPVSHERFPVLLLPALLAVGLIARLPELLQPIATDQGLFATYAQLMMAGERPYVAFWDVHPPLTYLFWMLAQAAPLGGSDWSRLCATLPGFQPLPCAGQVANALDMVATLVCGILCYLTAREAGGGRDVGWLAALLVVYFANLAMLSVGGSVPSKLTLVPCVLAVWAFLRARRSSGWAWPATAGAASVLAVLAKQPALLTVVALGSAAVWEAFQSTSARRRLQGFALGAVWTGVVAGGWLALAGGLGGFLEQVWSYNVARIVAGNWHAAAEGLTSPSVFRLDNVVRDALALPMVGALAGALAIVGRPSPTGQRIILWWALVNLIAIVGFREFIQVVPGLALLSAFGIERLWRAADANGLGLGQPWAGKVMLVALFGTILAFSSGFEVGQYRRAWFERGPGSTPALAELVAGRVRQTPPGPLFVWGNAGEVYALSGRAPATPYLNAEAVRLGAPGHEAARARLLAELDRARPTAIVLAPHVDEPELRLDGFPELAQRLGECYTAMPLAQPGADWALYERSAKCG